MSSNIISSCSNSSSSRRMRAFRRWMKCRGIDCSDALHLVMITTTTTFCSPCSPSSFSVSVRAVCDLQEGDLVATIPKHSCLTTKTSSGARRSHIIQHFVGGGDCNDNLVGLSVALMYERSLGELSPWFPYLQILPHSESTIPLLWTQHELHSLLTGTELHKIVEEEKGVLLVEWEEYIQPLVDFSAEFDSAFFTVEEYFAARSLVSSRSFEIDDYHGHAMVPLADLFNHKTGAEDVHITSVSADLIHESYVENITTRDDYENCGEKVAQISPSRIDHCEDTQKASSIIEDDPTVLEMIMVKDVNSGSEVFNTYGSLGNAALLNRYGFTELDNPYDIVNIDMKLVLEWSSSLFSSRDFRARLSLWRRLDNYGCVSENSEEYFEISFTGEPQTELLILLYILLLSGEEYFLLDHTLSSASGTSNRSFSSIAVLLKNRKSEFSETFAEMSDDDIRHMLLTEGVRDALTSLANIREGLYGTTSVEDDFAALKRCCHIKDRKLYYSLILRLSERRILGKLRSYATASSQLPETVAKRVPRKKKLRRS